MPIALEKIFQTQAKIRDWSIQGQSEEV